MAPKKKYLTKKKKNVAKKMKTVQRYSSRKNLVAAKQTKRRRLYQQKKINRSNHYKKGTWMHSWMQEPVLNEKDSIRSNILVGKMLKIRTLADGVGSSNLDYYDTLSKKYMRLAFKFRKYDPVASEHYLRTELQKRRQMGLSI